MKYAYKYHVIHTVVKRDPPRGVHFCDHRATVAEAAEMSQTTALAFDEFGRPFIIIRDQSTKRRLKGIEAHKVESRGALADRKTKLLSSLFSFLNHCGQVL